MVKTEEEYSCYKLFVGNKWRRIFLRTFTGDIDIFYEVFWQKVYALEKPQGIQTIVDLGGNIGMSAIYFSAICKNSRIITVEPDPKNYELLLRNCEAEISTKNVTPVHAAVYANDTKLYLKKSYNAYNSTVSDVGDVSDYVQGISMKRLCSDFQVSKIDLLKIDIEGSEQILFKNNFQWLKIVNNIMIETHSEASKWSFIRAAEAYYFKVNELKADGKSALLLAKKPQ